MKKPVTPKRNALNEIPGLAGFSFSHLLKILEAAEIVDAPKPDQSKSTERSKRFQSMWSAQIVPKVQSFIEQNLQTDEPSKGKWEKYIDRFIDLELNLSKALLEFLLKKNAVLVSASDLYSRSGGALKDFKTEVQTVEKELDLNSTQSKLIDSLDRYISLAIEKKKDSFSQYELKHKNVLINIFLKNITQNYARYIIQVQKSGNETIQAVKNLIKQIFSNLSNLQDKKRTDLEFVEKLFEYLHKKNQIFLVSSARKRRYPAKWLHVLRIAKDRWEEHKIAKITQESGIKQTQSELETLFHVYAPALILNKKQSIDNQQQIDELFKLFMININENWLNYFEKSKEQRVRNLLKISQSIILNSLRKLQNRKESSEMVEPAVVQRQIPNGDVMGENRKFQYKKVLKELKELEDKENVYNNEEEDYEYDMARNQLKTAVRAAKRIYKHIKDGEGDMEAWVQSKITTAVDYLDTVADYLDSCCEDDEEEKVEENKNLDSLVGKIANRRDGATDKAIQTINAYKEALNAIGGRIQQSGQRNVFAKQYTDAVIATNKLNANSTFAQLNDVKKMLTALADRINF